MPWTDDPEHVPADAVRSLVGDKDPAKPMLTDNEYAGFLATAENNVRRAAHAAALALAGKYAREADIASADQRISLGKISGNFTDLAQELLSNVSGGSGSLIPAMPMAGGIVDPTTGTDIPPFFTRDYPIA